jgi:two-component system, NarL family, response regulator DegU
MDKIKIMIVDDHEVVRRGLAMVLNLESDFEVIDQAQNSQEAFVKIEEMQPDIMILDMKMPGMSGRDVAAKIKADYPQVKIMMLSGAELDDEVFKTLDMGVDGYVLKDVSPDELNRAIRMVAQGQIYIHADVTRALLIRNRSPKENPPDVNLTPREAEVLQFLATSATYHEIGKQLSISEETVRSHAKGILAKLGQSNRTMAVVTAVRLGLIDLD